MKRMILLVSLTSLAVCPESLAQRGEPRSLIKENMAAWQTAAEGYASHSGMYPKTASEMAPSLRDGERKTMDDQDVGPATRFQEPRMSLSTVPASLPPARSRLHER